MPSLNYIKTLAPKVENGSKRQTMRTQRTPRIKAGDTLHHFTGLRTKSCRKLLVNTCTDVKECKVYDGVLEMDGRELSVNEIEDFARADGFANAIQFWDFFQKTYPLNDETPVFMDVIYW